MIPIVRALDAKIDQFRQAEGMILDLRGNLGGLGGMIVGVSGHFLNERVSLGTLKMRGSDLNFFANPRRVNSAGERVEPYSGPVAILVDALSLSAAEIFAGGMQAVGRVRVFGERTGGQALPAVWDRLPNGDVLYHAFGDFVIPSGKRLEGRGVVPDELVPVTREELLAGKDAPIEAALRWISESKRSGKGPENAAPK
jgi:carboxyl-terminal processing protease